METTFLTLSYFQKVAETEHLGRAAAELCVAQPSLSRMIRNLEAELGVPLFDHKGRNIALNEYGKILLKYVDRIFLNLDSAKREIQDALEAKESVVTLSIYAASKVIPSLLSAFRQEHPHIRFEIFQHDPSAQTDHAADLNLFSSIYPMDDEHTVTLLEEEIVLAIPKSDPRASAEALPLALFSGDDFISLQPGKSLRTITDAYCSSAGFVPHIHLECDSPSTVRDFIRAGLGISFVPCVTWSGVNDAYIALVHISAPKCRRYIGLSWSKEAYLSPSAVMVRDFFVRHFAEYSHAEAQPLQGQSG